MIQNQQKITVKGNSDNVGDETTEFQRAFVNGKIGGVKVEAGRNNVSLLGGEILSNRGDRVKVAYGKDVKLAAEYGKLSHKTDAFLAEEYAAISLSGKLGPVALEALYVDEKDDALLDDNNIWALQASYALTKDLGLKAAYLKGDVEVDGEDDGWYAILNYKGAKAAKVGSWGVYAGYYDLAASTYISNGWNTSYANTLRANAGYEGFKVGANYAVAKNMLATVEYVDLEAKDDSTDDKTLWTELKLFF